LEKIKQMKKIFLTITSLVAFVLLNAQQKEGKVIYERTMQMQIRIQDNDEAERAMPRSRTDKFELNFANNQSFLKQMEDDVQDDAPMGGGGGMQIRMVGPGADNLTYCNFDETRKVEKRDLFDKTFIVEDSIRRMTWKLSEETKTVLGHLCSKATTQRIGKRTMMTMDNGKMERKEMDDTSNITVWFTTDIPVSAGPDFQGQLPGLILEIDNNNGRMTYKALEILPKADVAIIKEPKGKNKITNEQFNKEREKMFEQMRQNGAGGGNRQIRIN
jgi:GLPGLI family protein